MNDRWVPPRSCSGCENGAHPHGMGGCDVMVKDSNGWQTCGCPIAVESVPNIVPQWLKFWYYAFRCWIKRPVTYRDWQYDSNDNLSWYFAMCMNCHRQIEVHDEGFGGTSSPPPGVMTNTEE